MKIVLVVDTNVVSYGFRQDPLFIDFYGPALQGHQAIVSFMTVAELEYGMRSRGWGPKNQLKLREYLGKHYGLYGVSHELIDTWAVLVNEARTLGRVLSSSDAWIAATAVLLKTPLVTHNAKDFAGLGGLTLVTLQNRP